MQLKKYVARVLKPSELKPNERILVEFSEEKDKEITKNGKTFKVHCAVLLGARDGNVFEIEVFASRLAPKPDEIELLAGKKYWLSKKDEDTFWIETDK